MKGEKKKGKKYEKMGMAESNYQIDPGRDNVEREANDKRSRLGRCTKSG